MHVHSTTEESCEPRQRLSCFSAFVEVIDHAWEGKGEGEAAGLITYMYTNSQSPGFLLRSNNNSLSLSLPLSSSLSLSPPLSPSPLSPSPPSLSPLLSLTWLPPDPWHLKSSGEVPTPFPSVSIHLPFCFTSPNSTSSGSGILSHTGEGETWRRFTNIIIYYIYIHTLVYRERVRIRELISRGFPHLSSGYTFSMYHLNDLQLSFFLSSNLSVILEQTDTEEEAN